MSIAVASSVRTVCMDNDMDVCLAIPLSDSELETLSQCELFANTVLKITSDLRKGINTSEKLPPFPKKDLMKISCGSKSKPDKTARGRELHKYLNSRIQNITGSFKAEIPPPPKGTLDDIIIHLVLGYTVMKKMSAKTLSLSLHYGASLNKAFQVYESNKARGLVKEAWGKWLVKNVGVSAFYASKLRELSTIFMKYKTIHNLSIPFSELWNKKLEIKEMLNTHPDLAKYWLDG